MKKLKKTVKSMVAEAKSKINEIDAKEAIKFEANKRNFQDKLQTLAEQHAINQSVHDEKYKSRSSKHQIKWRPDIGEYMSDYDYNIYMLKKARMGNE